MPLRVATWGLACGLCILALPARGLEGGGAGAGGGWGGGDWGLELTGLVESDTAVRLRDPQELQKSQNRLELEAVARLPYSLRLRALGRLIWDQPANLVGEKPNFGQDPIDRWQIDGSRRVEAELRELTLDWSTRVGHARLDLRVGKQQVVWGQSFGVRVLDVVNAQDYREFILDEFVDSRIPVFGLRADASVRGWSLQALVFPDYEPDRLAPLETEYQFNPRLPGLVPTLADFAIGPIGPFSPVEVQKEEIPSDWQISTVGFGGRVGRHVRGVDLSLHYWDAYESQPIFRRHVELRRLPEFPAFRVPVNLLRAEHARVRTVGASASTTWRDLTFWGEGLAAFDRPFVISEQLGRRFNGSRLPLDPDSDGTQERTEVQYTLGVDWTGWEHLFADVQFLHSLIPDQDREIQVQSNRTFASLLLRFDFLHETLLPQLYFLYGFDEGESMIRPSLEWKATDHWSVTVGADLFSGPSEGVLGQFAQRLECNALPANLPRRFSPGACEPAVGPGRPSRAFVRVRFAFGRVFGR